MIACDTLLRGVIFFLIPNKGWVAVPASLWFKKKKKEKKKEIYNLEDGPRQAIRGYVWLEKIGL